MSFDLDLADHRALVACGPKDIRSKRISLFIRTTSND